MAALAIMLRIFHIESQAYVDWRRTEQRELELSSKIPPVLPETLGNTVYSVLSLAGKLNYIPFSLIFFKIYFLVEGEIFC